MAYGNLSPQTTECKERSGLEDIKFRLSGLHEIATDLHGVADRACGIRGEGEANGPSPVPNGLMDEIRDLLIGLDSRLSAAAGRLRRIA